MPDKRQQSVMLIDGYGLIFRAYHAIDSAMATSSGEQTNAVFGFARMLLDVLESQRPDYAIVALEGGKTFRHEEYRRVQGKSRRHAGRPAFAESTGFAKSSMR